MIICYYPYCAGPCLECVSVPQTGGGNDLEDDSLLKNRVILSLLVTNLTNGKFVKI